MGLTKQLLESHCKSRNLTTLQFVCLPGLGIHSIDRLANYSPNVEVLFVQGNLVKDLNVSTFFSLKNLWVLDVSDNCIQSLDGLDQFIVFGFLNLSGNKLSWRELRKIIDVTILSLSLYNNEKLECDANYRKHVVDLFPKVWFLDGLIITTEERSTVESFFKHESNRHKQPIRRKFSKNIKFFPTCQRNMLKSRIHGLWTERFMKKFPLSFSQNSELDTRRISFLCESYLESFQCTRILLDNERLIQHNIYSLAEIRNEYPESCNMILLILIVYIVFSLPNSLVVDCLTRIHLDCLNGLDFTFLILNSSAQFLVFIISILLAYLLVDFDKGIKNGVYFQLFNAIYLAATDIFTCKSSFSKNTDYTCVLASEVLEPFCLIERFFHLIGEDEGVSTLIIVATRDPFIIKEIHNLRSSDIHDPSTVYNEISSLLLHKSLPNILYCSERKSDSENLHYNMISHRRLKSAHIDHIREFCPSVNLSNRIDDDQPDCARFKTPNNSIILRPGDFVRLHCNKLARVISVIAPNLALLSAFSQPMNEFVYVNVANLAWDPMGRWFVTHDNHEYLDSDPIHRSSCSIYISHPSSPLFFNSPSLDLSSVQSDTLHCISLTNDLLEEEKSKMDSSVDFSSQITSEEAMKERAYMDRVIDGMDLYNSNWSRDDIYLDKLRKFVAPKQPKMYDAISMKSQCVGKPVVHLNNQKFATLNNSCSRPIFNDSIVLDDQCFQPQCWIEVSKPKHSSSPHISVRNFDIEFQYPQIRFSWSSTRTSTTLKSKQKCKKQIFGLSEPLLCVTGSNLNS